MRLKRRKCPNNSHSLGSARSISTRIQKEPRRKKKQTKNTDTKIERKNHLKKEQKKERKKKEQEICVKPRRNHKRGLAEFQCLDSLYLVIRRRSRKLGDPARRGIEGERLDFERGADPFDDADEDDDEEDDEEEESESEDEEESDDWSESESEEESAELDEELDDEDDETESRLLFLTLGFLSWSI